MKKSINFLAVISCFVLSATLAHADGEKCDSPMHKSVHKHEMKSNDGTAHLDRLFNAADANHDGGLDKEEANAMPMLKAYFDKVDANKDGKVTRQEYLDAMPLLHRAKDIDTSGKGQML